MSSVLDDETGVCKTVNDMEIVDSEPRQIRFTISNESIDSDGDVISSKGWDLAQFKRNNIVLWQHDRNALPVGKVVDIGVEGNALKATVEFPEATINDHADKVFQLLKQGYLSACSVGFMPTDYTISDRVTKSGRPGLDIAKAQLYELSIVTLPANFDALVETRALETPEISQAFIAQNIKARRKHRLSVLLLNNHSQI
jgi:uncharacterized protein